MKSIKKALRPLRFRWNKATMVFK